MDRQAVHKRDHIYSNTFVKEYNFNSKPSDSLELRINVLDDQQSIFHVLLKLNSKNFFYERGLMCLF